MSSHTSTYIHVDDHRHNDLTACYVRDWLWSLAPRPNKTKIWYAELHIIPLRHYKAEDTAMASRTKKTPTQNTSGDWRGFVNVNLSEDEWAFIDKEMTDKKVGERLPSHLDYLLELGKVTFNYTNGSISCALTILEGAQKGFTVSSFSDNLVEALLTTRLKVQNYLPEFENIFAGGQKQQRRRG